MKVHRLKNIDRKCWDLTLLFSFSFFFFLAFAIKTPTNGDTYIYAQSISTFEGPLIHIGYFLVGKVIHFFLKYFGATPLQTLTYISIFFGGFSVVCMYLFTFMLTEDRLQSLLAALILMFSGPFWVFSIHGEVYVPQLAFVLLSGLLIIKRMFLFSSLSILVAIFITPTSFLAIPPLIYLINLKKFEKIKTVTFILPIIMTVFFLVLWDISRIIRILSWAIYSPKVFFESFSYKALILEVVYSLIREYGRSFGLLSFFAIFGFVVLHKEDRKAWWLMLMFMLPFSLYLLNLGLIRGRHLIISFVPISFLVSFGIIYLFNKMDASLQIKHLGIILILFCHLFVSNLLFVSPEVRDVREVQRVISKLADDYKTDAIMISHYSFGAAFWYLTKKEKDFYFLSGRPDEFLAEHGKNSKSAVMKIEKEFWIELAYLPHFFRLADFRLLLKTRSIYFVDQSYWPTWIVQFLKTDKSHQKRKREAPKLRKLESYLEKMLDEEIDFLKIIDSPLNPVYILHRF